MVTINEIEKQQKPLVLIIDDVLMNLQVVGKLLYDAGYNVAMVESGDEALRTLDNIHPDLILLDIMMPEIDGFEVSKMIKNKDEYKNTPIIFLTSRTQTEDILRGFEHGGVDYIIKPFEKEILLARIKTHLDLKFSREQLEQKSKEIQKVNERLIETNIEKDRILNLMNKELEIAAEYVTNLLPLPIDKGIIKTNWKFVPSAQLGGDSFGYHWIDNDNLAIYLLDVCYHGIGPALLSISVLNLLRFQNLRKTDFKKPDEVLNALNSVFQMTEHNEMYFSIWYGVYNINTRIITYASAGHPPAIIIDENGNDYYLKTKNIFIGIVKEYNYKSDIYKIQKPSNLYIFSDGVFEIEMTNGKRWTLEEFYDFMKISSLKHKDNGSMLEMEEVYNYGLELRNGEKLKDDFSILKVSFS
jgi:sigma-B regulation protein RsbU (phosphoserine phosphatase)